MVATTSAREVMLRFPKFCARSRVSLGSVSPTGLSNPGQVRAVGRDRDSSDSTCNWTVDRGGRRRRFRRARDSADMMFTLFIIHLRQEDVRTTALCGQAFLK